MRRIYFIITKFWNIGINNVIFRIDIWFQINESLHNDWFQSDKSFNNRWF